MNIKKVVGIILIVLGALLIVVSAFGNLWMFAFLPCSLLCSIGIFCLRSKKVRYSDTGDKVIIKADLPLGILTAYEDYCVISISD